MRWLGYTDGWDRDRGPFTVGRLEYFCSQWCLETWVTANLPEVAGEERVFATSEGQARRDGGGVRWGPIGNPIPALRGVSCRNCGVLLVRPTASAPGPTG